ncbi:hypothetical protein FEM48_Zijuj06G0165100 [Ziziphus jujuba var. spinosa]|uniref:Amino acid transporter transmembrane domain-containing protein n=1 Tax=Ziziphus jujuba var. spinosa TaxID=714518 RepID=A0A978VAD5_ZIZJJ|nr:hypothetical protein FEM48_Zijuj06G0165100 [Ziziphus jujuba var. spinosa]
MRDKRKFGKVVAFTMASICLIYGSFGALGYFAFGEQTEEMITANMGVGLVTTLVKFGLCVNIFFTLLVMMNSVYEIMEKRFWGGRYCLWIRWLSVLLVSLMAILVPNFAGFLCLMGSGVCCALGFILPSLFHLVVFRDEMARGTWCFDVSIMVVGLVLGVSGT